MHKHTWLILLALAMGQLSSHEQPGKSAARPEDKLKLLQGRWLLVEAYSALPQPDGARHISREVFGKPHLEVEFFDDIGVVRDIREDGSRSKPAPFCLKVDVRTDPISFDQVSYPLRPRGHLFFIGILKVEQDKLYLAYSPDLMTRPKSFDIKNDPGIAGLAIYRWAKD